MEVKEEERESGTGEFSSETRKVEEKKKEYKMTILWMYITRRKRKVIGQVVLEEKRQNIWKKRLKN